MPQPSTVYVIFSIVVVLAVFLIQIAGLDAALLSRPGMATVSFYIIGNPALWTVLFLRGLRRHGNAALWLMLVFPFAFFYILGILTFVIGGR